MNTTAELVKIDPSQYGLEVSEARQVEAVFIPMIDAMTELEEEFNQITRSPISQELCLQAKNLRLRYVKIRTGTAAIHKKAKAYYLAGGRFVDGWKNAQTFASQGKEERLQEIEEHYIRQEAERIEGIRKERSKQLEIYTDAIPSDIGYMPEEVFINYLEGVKIAHAARIKAEKDAEDARLAKEQAEAEERERLRVENEKLRKEKERLEAEARQREKAERERLEAEARANQAQEAEERARSKRPEKDQMKEWISALELPNLHPTSEAGKRTAMDIMLKFEGFKRWAFLQIDKL